MSDESAAGQLGYVNLDKNTTGKRSAGKPHAAFDVAEAGNGTWLRSCGTRKTKGRETENTNFDLNNRASLRPYQIIM